MGDKASVWPVPARRLSAVAGGGWLAAFFEVGPAAKEFLFTRGVYSSTYQGSLVVVGWRFQFFNC